ncbi:hypothetical protein MCOR01_009953 [Pyricularia oryzae]|nr:hypothetical protein MCOR01_009953 [Pyricularia oryzae]
MGSWTGFVLTYLFGGITFLPLLLLVVFVHGYLTFPDRPDLDPRTAAASGANDGQDDIVQPGDDIATLKAAQKLSREETRARASQNDSDVAAGYFAVCREYEPMGINAKPIERATPVGSATVAAPSQSVYQAMYRTIFDRKQAAGPLDGKNGTSQRPRKAGNVFYVVLRHGHIMLFDDDEQLEVRHVISLAHHDISIFSGEDSPTPEGELYIKKNAICLTRKEGGLDATAPDAQLSKPFYLFSENCSAKEDFYFSLLRNQKQSFRGEQAGVDAPTPMQYDVKHIISLVQKLHSSEDHLPTRWLNGMIGRVFLGIYRTKDLENLIREKLTKKISRVKRPSFLSNISIQRIETGDSAPYITNPRLKDLTVEGECGVEADIKYTGNFRIEVAATARIDLGSRFKAREVNLVLAVVLRKLEGHVLFKIKPPPSNRLWFSFQTMPKMEMTLEPIVSSKQITYGVILRQLESRIKEVVAETLVLPFWDDSPFFNTEHKKWRGGIFEGDDAVVSSADLESLAAQLGAVDEVEKSEEQSTTQAAQSTSDLPPMEKSHSLPVLEQTSTTTGALFGQKSSTSTKSKSSGHSKRGSISSTNTETRPQFPPRPSRSGSITGPSSPVVSTDTVNSDIFKPSSSPPYESAAAQAMAHLSARSAALGTSPPDSRPAGPASKPSNSSHVSVASSRDGTDSEKDRNFLDATPRPDRRHTVSSTNSGKSDEDDGSPAASIKSNLRAQTGTLTRNFFLRHKTSTESLAAVGGSGTGDTPKRNAMEAIATAATVAKRWGLNALQRNASDANGVGGKSEGGADREDQQPLDLSKPMGGGRPLPPPGTPLPMPDKNSKVTSIPVPQPKRRPIVPPPQLVHPGEQQGSGSNNSSQDNVSRRGGMQRKTVPPPLPKRRHAQQNNDSPSRANGDMMLVVEAPADSEPTSPMSATSSDGGAGRTGYRRPWAEVEGDEAYEEPSRGRSRSSQRRQGAQDVDDDEGVSAWMDDGDAVEEELAQPPKPPKLPQRSMLAQLGVAAK